MKVYASPKIARNSLKITKKIIMAIGGTHQALSDRFFDMDRSITQSAIGYWFSRKTAIPAEFVIPLEKIAKDVGLPYTRHDIRPDIYPTD